jgi:hypothetical protein
LGLVDQNVHDAQSECERFDTDSEVEDTVVATVRGIVYYPAVADILDSAVLACDGSGEEANLARAGLRMGARVRTPSKICLAMTDLSNTHHDDASGVVEGSPD